MCIHVFWAHGRFFSSGRGSFLVLSPRGTQGARRQTTAQVWARADVRGTCSGGFKVAGPHGEGPRRAAGGEKMAIYARICA